MSQEALQEIMRKVEGEPYADVLSMMLLRSMQQARYSEHNHGHYGLAADIIPTLPVPFVGIRTDGSSNGARIRKIPRSGRAL